MGAGRLFALLGALCAVSAPARASAGAYDLLAQGSGIELRDAQNRVVSRAAVASALRAGQRSEESQAAALTGTRAARWLGELLDRLAAPAEGLRRRAEPGRAAVTAAPAPRPPKAAFFPTVPRRLPAPGRLAARTAPREAALTAGGAFATPLRR